jgi:hypothetical protein
MNGLTAITILFLASNPKGTSRLRLDQEVRDISEGLLRSKYRDLFELEQRWAVRPRDIQRALLDLNPQIVHFAGHGTGRPGIVLEAQRTNSQDARDIGIEPESAEAQGLAIENDDGSISLVSGEALANLFKLFSDTVKCVVLNGCYTEIQAEVISHYIPYVIGMNKAIGDQAAIEFAVGFYDALGAGRSIEFAYELGCNALRLAGIPEYLTPVLKKNPNVTADLTVTVEPNSRPGLDRKQRIQRRQEDLEEAYEELRRKLKRLRKDYIVESDSEAKYKLERRIEDCEAELQKIEQELDQLENDKMTKR